MLALLVILGWAATYIALRLTMRRKLESLRRQLRETQDRINGLERSIESSRGPNPMPQKPAAAIKANTPVAAPVNVPTKSEKEEVNAEMLVIIAAAITAYLGKKVRIRSAQLLQTPFELFNPWAQQGRVVIQASHNLTQRGHRE